MFRRSSRKNNQHVLKQVYRIPAGIKENKEEKKDNFYGTLFIISVCVIFLILL